MIHRHTILSLFKRRDHWLVFIVCVVLLSLLQWHPSFPDPDSFYHARIAVQMIQGPVLLFTSLPLTALSDTFIDHHFLYHILLIPFVVLNDPLVGLKIATVIFAAAFLAFFYRILRTDAGASTGIALIFLLFLVLNTVFLFRLNLAKIPAVSLIVFFLGLLAIIKRRHAHLFGLSFLYVWLYGGWPLLPLSSLISFIIQTVIERGDGLMKSAQTLLTWRDGGVPLERFDEGSPKRQEHTVTPILTSLSLPIASFSGALAGLVINPYFPTNIFFTWIQTFKIALFNILIEVPVGGEWYPPGVSFIPAHGPTLMLLVFSLCAFCFPGLFALVFRTREPRRSAHQWFLCVLTLLFFALTLKSKRYGEYFAPLATIFSAFVLAPLLGKEHLAHFFSLIRKNLCAIKTARGVITLYFLIAGPAIIGANVYHIIGSFRSGYVFSRYTDGMAWIQKNIPTGSRIFHNRWDDFPIFYYRSPEYQYISGLDLRFFFEKNPVMAKEYTIFSKGEDFTRAFGFRSLCTAVQTSLGSEPAPPPGVASVLECTPLAEKQKTADVIASFNPAVIVITHADMPLDKKIRGVRGFTEVYRDSDMVILQPQE